MDLFFDLVIMAMLMVTIIYAWRLNSKLNVIRNYKADLKSNIQEFYNATEKAEKAVKDLQKEGRNICKDIDDKISKARLTADELDILVSRAKRNVMEVKEKTEAPVARSAGGLDDLLEEPYNSNFSISSIRRKFSSGRIEPKLDSKFNSLQEADLAKLLREKQLQDALVG